MLCAVIISFPHVQDGFTPLYVACQNRHEQIVIVLLESGANVNLTMTVSSLSGARKYHHGYSTDLYVCNISAIHTIAAIFHVISYWSSYPFYNFT